MHKMENHLGRLALCLSRVRAGAEGVLKIHPISSIWTECRSDRAGGFPNHLEMVKGWLMSILLLNWKKVSIITGSQKR